ncbi:MAG TPA: EAL domain-containing protein [Allosphingosinicella sp.]|nr:EAL domain-containing protein [Allosphingosinicella sp.]
MSDISLPKLDWRVILNRAAPPGRRGWGRVRASQLAAMRRVMPFAFWGQALSALLMVTMLDGQVPRAHLAIWLLSLITLMGFAACILWKWRKRELRSVSRAAIDRAAYHGIVFACLWAAPAAHVFGGVDHSAQLAIWLAIVSMMAGAAFIFATVPSAAMAFVLVLGGAASNMLASGPSQLMAIVGPIYVGALCLTILANGRAFMRRKCIELALEERSETVSLLLREYENSGADWLWQTNSQLCLQNVSSRFARAVGRRADELEGMSLLDLLPRQRAGDAGRGKPSHPIRANLERREAFTAFIVPIAGRDSTRSIELSARPRFNGRGRFLGYRGVGSDVTEARRTADRIEHMARHDALTALPNRLQLTEELELALAQARANNRQCAILLIDLDRFKTVNDSLGHIAGDHLLQQVSTRFAPLLSPGMTVGRIGGDEFALVIPRAGDRKAIMALSQAIVDAMKEPFLYHDQHLFVGASIGVALGPMDGGSVEELIRNADLALYRAKDNGGNSVHFYEPSLHAEAEERRRIELALRSALEGDEFTLVYQPVVDAATSRIMGFEALLRWTNPILGAIEPVRFVPIAEDTGLLGRIGDWALRTACAEAAKWPKSISVAVNVSPRQLEEPGFMLALVSALSQPGLEPHRLEIEITETVFLDVTPQTRKVLQQIRSLGVRLAMDDFGTGYSSLGYLREANFDTLKVDRSFVGELSASDPESGAIIKAVIALAGSLGMKTVAEGVETDEQLEMVRALGCDRVQGYRVSDPVAAHEVQSLLAADQAAAAAA